MQYRLGCHNLAKCSCFEGSWGRATRYYPTQVRNAHLPFQLLQHFFFVLWRFYSWVIDAFEQNWRQVSWNGNSNFLDDCNTSHFNCFESNCWNYCLVFQATHRRRRRERRQWRQQRRQRRQQRCQRLTIHVELTLKPKRSKFLSTSKIKNWQWNNRW